MKKSLLFVIGVLASLQTYACSCASWETAQDLKKYDAVWLAIPEASSTVVGTTPNETHLVTKLNVVRSFKTKGLKVRELHSLQDTGSNCGISFTENQGLILIGASKGADGKLMTNVCSVGYVDGQDPRIMNIIRSLNNQF